jgi:hypothetical protein
LIIFSFFFSFLQQEAMINLFFDVLPIEIREEIYGIRLSNALKKNYYRRCATKVALARILMKLEMSYDFILYDSGRHSLPYLNPLNSNVRYVAERCSKVITSSHDCIWWIAQLIRPIEEGLIMKERLIYYDSAFESITERDALKARDAKENYMRTEHVVDQLIELFGCRRNPRRQRIDWRNVPLARSCVEQL